MGIANLRIHKTRVHKTSLWGKVVMNYTEHWALLEIISVAMQPCRQKPIQHGGRWNKSSKYLHSLKGAKGYKISSDGCSYKQRST